MVGRCYTLSALSTEGSKSIMTKHFSYFVIVLATSMMVSLTSPSLQAGNGNGKGPPDHAPAHGYRNKHKKHKKHKEHRGGDADIVISSPRRHTPPPFACDHSSISNADIGSVLGGVIGGILGSKVGKGKGNTAAIIAGTVIGSILGNSVGSSMDDVDQYCSGQTFEQAPDNQPVAWVNPDTQRQYTVTPTKSYEERDGRTCREYSTDVQVGGRSQEGTGTACRNSDGSWQIVN